MEANVAVVATITALIVQLPLKCAADVRERGAELTFYVGAKLGYCHRNDTNAADCSAAATAVQFVPIAALFAFILRGNWGQSVAFNILRNSPVSAFILEQKFITCQLKIVRVFKPKSVQTDLFYSPD
ncbi:MAG: hypothetical protein H0X30_01650 [Anaerolineae bacterium]|nr:hypothetical protein [Anaerolineae bacterium]